VKDHPESEGLTFSERMSLSACNGVGLLPPTRPAMACRPIAIFSYCSQWNRVHAYSLMSSHDANLIQCGWEGEQKKGMGSSRLLTFIYKQPSGHLHTVRWWISSAVRQTRGL